MTYRLYPLCCLIVSINKPLPDIWLKVGANVKLCGMSEVNGAVNYPISAQIF